MKNKLIEILEAYDEEFSLLELKYEEEPLIQDGLTITCEKVHGGREGAGEEYWMVLKVTNKAGEISYWEIPGYYQSYDGGELEIRNIFEVEPVEETIIVYKKKK